MKKLIIALLTLTIINLASGVALAQTKTPTPTKKLASTPTPEVTKEDKEIDTIEKIKDLVASKVAELNLVEKRGIVGSVRETSNTQITVTDHKGKVRIIDIDELTKFEAGSDEDSFGISDIEKNDNLSVIGLYNKDTERLLARFISRSSTLPVNTDAVVTDIDDEEFILTVVTEKGEKRTVDIETSTKTSSYDADEDEIIKSGFSKIELGERILLVGFMDLKEKDNINASRIIHFPTLKISSNMKKFQNEVKSEEVPVSTGSAGKIQPITR